MRSAALLFALAFAVSPAAAPQSAKPTGQSSKPDSLPPLSWTCPMHPEILEDKQGACPICKMNLVPIRLDSIWSCPVHSVVAESRPGTCRIDGRDLIQVTVAVSWTCPGSTQEATAPGACPDGAPMRKKYSPRPHGNHNPQHGGQFFMAPDNWHHLEGALPRAGVFRVYLYDDYTKPLPRTDFTLVKGRVVTKQTFDAATKTTKEIAAFPLVPISGGKYLEAKVGRTAFPAQLTARLKFKAEGPEYPFDFTFDRYTKEPATAPRTTSAATAPTTVPAPVPSAPAPDTPGVSSGIDPALVPLPLPDTVPEMLAQLGTRTSQIRALIDRGSFGSIYVPAFQAKDIALALDEHRKELTEEQRRVVAPAVAKLVRSAWLLDAFGDIGNKQQISEAYAKFVEAAKAIQTSFPAQP